MPGSVGIRVAGKKVSSPVDWGMGRWAFVKYLQNNEGSLPTILR